MKSDNKCEGLLGVLPFAVLERDWQKHVAESPISTMRGFVKLYRTNQSLFGERLFTF